METGQGSCKKCKGWVKEEDTRYVCLNCGYETIKDYWDTTERGRKLQFRIDKQLNPRSAEASLPSPKSWGPALAEEQRLADIKKRKEKKTP